MTTFVHAVDRPDLPPREMPSRFKHDVTYFMTPSGNAGVPELSAGEYWIRLQDAQRWIEDLVIEVVSPLNSATKAEIELTEEQEEWLDWMIEHKVERIRLES